jgi:hypothetical protein
MNTAKAILKDVWSYLVVGATFVAANSSAIQSLFKGHAEAVAVLVSVAALILRHSNAPKAS